MKRTTYFGPALLTIAIVLLFGTAALPCYAGGGLFGKAFKLAGWVAGTAVRSVPTVVGFSIKSAKAAANIVSTTNTAVDDTEGYVVGQTAGYRAGQLVKSAAGTNQIPLGATARAVVSTGQALSGKGNLAGLVRSIGRAGLRK